MQYLNMVDDNPAEFIIRQKKIREEWRGWTVKPGKLNQYGSVEVPGKFECTDMVDGMAVRFALNNLDKNNQLADGLPGPCTDGGLIYRTTLIGATGGLPKEECEEALREPFDCFHLWHKECALRVETEIVMFVRRLLKQCDERCAEGEWLENADSASLPTDVPYEIDDVSREITKAFALPYFNGEENPEEPTMIMSPIQAPWHRLGWVRGVPAGDVLVLDNWNWMHPPALATA